MADIDSIRLTADRLETCVLELTLLAEITHDLAGPGPRAPQWPYLILQHAQRITELVHILGDEVRQC